MNIELSVKQLQYITDELIKSENTTLAFLETCNISNTVDVMIGDHRFILDQNGHTFQIS